MPTRSHRRFSARYGKLDRRTMEEVVYRNLGAPDGSVLVGPKAGFDNAFVSINGKRVMVVTTDPVSVIPRIGVRKSAWLSVHLIASDLATSGVAPEFASFSLNFPSEMSSAEKREYLRSLGKACKEIGVAIVAGHTGAYPGAAFTVVGGGTMIGFANEGGYVDPSMARVGDSILMTKGAAIETTASLAASFPRSTEQRIGKRLAKAAREMLDDCSTVKEALLASSVGMGESGITSMHDATEGGVLGGLHEMARASNRAFFVDQDSIFVSKQARAVCAAFAIDPLTSLSEGTLLMTCVPSRVGEIRRRIRRAGIAVYKIGSVREGSGLWVSKAHGRPRKVRPAADGYWTTYDRSVAVGLR